MSALQEVSALDMVTARAVSVPTHALVPLHVPEHPSENDCPKQTLTAFEQSGVQPGGVGAHGGPQYTSLQLLMWETESGSPVRAGQLYASPPQVSVKDVQPQEVVIGEPVGVK